MLLFICFNEIFILIYRAVMPMEEVKITPINESKIIIISDTHIGSIYENLDYLNQVYDYAIKHNVKTILHGGDLLQGPYKNVSNKYRDMETQINHLLETYPNDNSITNQIIFGNHDYQIIKTNPELQDLISRQDFNILGVRKSYFNWQDNLISISHKCPKYKVVIPNLETLVNFAGHAHKFSLHERKGILIPTLSDDTKFDSAPGFLVATLTETFAYVELITFSKTISEPQLVYKKSLSEHKNAILI